MVNFTQETVYNNSNSSGYTINLNGSIRNYNDSMISNKNNLNEKFTKKCNSNVILVNNNTYNIEDKSTLILETIRENEKETNGYAHKYNYNNLFKERN